MKFSKLAEILRDNKDRGFTIVELVVVVSIVAIIIAIASVSYIKATEGTKLDQAQTVLQTIIHGQRSRNQDSRGFWPPTGSASTLQIANGVPLNSEGYVPTQDWGAYPYVFWGANPRNVNRPCVVIAKAARAVTGPQGTTSTFGSSQGIPINQQAVCADNLGNIQVFSRTDAPSDTNPPIGCSLCGGVLAFSS